MEKILKQIMVLVCIVSMLMPFSTQPNQVSASSVKRFKCETKPGFNSITFKWEVQKGVSYYNIYRRNNTRNDYLAITPKEKDYKKIATITSDKLKYVDKKVKRGVKYAYIIKGFRERKGKDLLVCTTLQIGETLTYVAGLDKPVLKGSGSKKYKGRLKYNCFSVSSEYGMEPTGYVIYRKKVGETDYKKIKLKKVSKRKFVDTKTEPGSIYKYKVKTYIKRGKKKYYSKLSSSLELGTSRYVASYKAKLLNKPGIKTSVLAFQVTGKSAYNGTAIFYPKECAYFYQETENTEHTVHMLKLKEYSFDNQIWKTIPKKGIAFKGKETIYLRGDLYEEDTKESTYIFWGEDKPYESSISFNYGDGDIAIQYRYRAYNYYTEANLDFISGTGRAHQEGD